MSSTPSRLSFRRPLSSITTTRNKHDVLMLVLVLLLATSTIADEHYPLVVRGKSTATTIPTAGPIEDAQCNIEDLEEANDSQLHSILSDLTKTAFFRNIRVDLNHKCPLKTWRKRSDSDKDDEDEEAEFECTGGAAAAAAADDPFASVAGDEEESVPLCQVLPGDSQDDPATLFEDAGRSTKRASTGPPPATALDSNALRHLSMDGFESRSQQKTFAWRQHSDIIVKNTGSQEPCDSEPNNALNLLPDSFWMDMCSNITIDGTTVVNLALNPERNTGYNGTHIWKAIYEENCITSGQDMCLEQRVLYRLFSGLHTSTTLSIAKNYYPPSKRKNRPDWRPNPNYFYDKFHDNPDHVRNLHFSYVLLLRALSKASTFLYSYEIRTGDIVEDQTANVLLKRLLDSSILGSCNSVFSAFDESLMFSGHGHAISDLVSLQQNFKGVFHNVSSILDCVQCQQCKLHGKLTMLGYGAALKVLLLKKPILDRNEIVALINSIARFSESIREVRELTDLYWRQENVGPPKATPTDPIPFSMNDVDRAVQLVAELGRTNQWESMETEAKMVQRALDQDPQLLILAKHYADNPSKFLYMLQQTTKEEDLPDAIIVGSGLAGLSAALSILDRGGRVVIVEKEHLLGGNSNKASSGINACCPDPSDSLERFVNDTIRSAGTSARPDLINVLVENSGNAVAWLKSKGVDLSLVAQLGGHSAQRTHRPNNGMAGAEIIYAVSKAVRQQKGVEIMLDTQVTSLIQDDDDGRVVGVKYTTGDNNVKELRAHHVILATGGFAADRTAGSLLSKYRPELLELPTTAGAFSTGDGVGLAQALGADVVDMDKVQLHPTGWVDPANPNDTTKILAAELMRGVGGILINANGKRFCNELGTRQYVTNRMLSHDVQFQQTGKWNVKSTVPTFWLVLSSSAAAKGKKHVDLYTHKGLLTRVEGVSALAKHLKNTIVQTLQQYQRDAKNGKDEWGKTTFNGVPNDDLEEEVFYVGRVTPVLHYCMGGITIDDQGRVLSSKGASIIPNLFAAGEVTGGVHGVNRLGGNSLLECTVFGTRVGNNLPIQKRRQQTATTTTTTSTKQNQQHRRIVTTAELQQHSTEDDCWVAIHGTVYDLTDFAPEHPAGAESITDLCAQDGSHAFAAVHNENLLQDFEQDRIGTLEEEN